MYDQQAVWVDSSGDERCTLRPRQANHHGLIAGATRTGKAVTLKVVAESFSDAGVPVFLTDVKGDLAGMCRPGGGGADMQVRITRFGLQEAGLRYRAHPTEFWNVSGKRDFPPRMTASKSGPLLFTRPLNLNKIQSDLLKIIFHITDEEGLLLLGMKDLKSMVRYVEEDADAYREQYGNIGKSSAGVILRTLVALGGEGGAQFLGEPALQISDWMRVDANGRDYVNILDLTSLIQDPTVYPTPMLWMLNKSFAELPEAGDLGKPKMVFFFGGAHLLFDNAPKTLLDKIEQVMKLIRSKGVGAYFVTQDPSDILSGVLAQLGNGVQRALHAYTPAEQKGVKTAAELFRENPASDTATAFQELKTTEVLVSFLDEGDAPEEVQITSTLPPQSKFNALGAITRQAAILTSSLRDKYTEEVDRESTYELLLQRVDEQVATAAKAKEEAGAERQAAKEATAAGKQAAKEAAAAEKQAAREAVTAVKQTEKEAATAAWEEKKKAARQKRIFTSINGSVTGTVRREVGRQLGKSTGGSSGRQLGGNTGVNLGRGILRTLLKF